MVIKIGIKSNPLIHKLKLNLFIPMGKSFTSNIADAWGPFGGAQVDGTMVGSHLGSPDDVTNMPYFPTGCKSLL